MIELRPLSAENMETVRVWRLGCAETLRTPYMLTAEMQQQYYRDVICDRKGSTRYWGLWLVVEDDGRGAVIPGVEYFPPRGKIFIGYGGLENISNENGNAEISLLIGPEYRKKGYGREAVKLFLGQAFNTMRLHSVYGECYECGPWQFWYGLPHCIHTWLPDRKFWNGSHVNSLYFTFYKENYENLMRDTSESDKHETTGQESESVPGQADDTAEYRVGACDWINGCGGIE